LVVRNNPSPVYVFPYSFAFFWSGVDRQRDLQQDGDDLLLQNQSIAVFDLDLDEQASLQYGMLRTLHCWTVCG
jgi:hypothetical protein